MLLRKPFDAMRPSVFQSVSGFASKRRRLNHESEGQESTLELVVGDITKQETEAIVNAANNRLAPGGGVAGAIHRAAGPDLWEECKKLGGCETGQARLTRGYRLPALYVIHTVGPVYSGSNEDAKLLASCYRKSLRVAKERGIKSVSFPAISTGIFGYPVEEAAKIALKTVLDVLRSTPSIQLVRLVLRDSDTMSVHEKALKSLMRGQSW
jgi:O-acetyl-ADP-ribose deacetylase (regulator of RNase III)